MTHLVGNSSEDLKLGEERIPVEEEQAIKDLTETQLLLMKSTDPTKRGAHPKGHGCILAKFTVLPDIPDPQFIVGIFAEPRTYQAVIRFSNAAFPKDGQPEVHGMAIKLFGVKGEKILTDEKDAETQDFIVSDMPVFFAKDVQTFAEFLKARVTSALKKDERYMQEFIAKHPAVIPMRDLSRKTPPSPLDNDYWSQTPYRLGPIAVKYAVKHRPENSSGRLDRASDDYLRDELVEHFVRNEKSAAFDFFVQKQTDPIRTPIEDPTVVWTSPEVRVATITIEREDFNSETRNKFCEDSLSFTPWHCLKEHQPLGGINRARRVIYEESSKLRHEKTSVPRKEPTEESLQGK